MTHPKTVNMNSFSAPPVAPTTANGASLDWNTVTSDLQRSVNNLALFVLESMTVPTWLPTLFQGNPLPVAIDMCKPPPAIYDLPTELSSQQKLLSPSVQPEMKNDKPGKRRSSAAATAAATNATKKKRTHPPTTSMALDQLISETLV